MHVFDLLQEQEFNQEKHVEKILGTFGEGDVTVACWEPGQVSPYHCHPYATEIYFCFQGGGSMKTPDGNVDVTPGLLLFTLLERSMSIQTEMRGHFFTE
ncbi:MAG: cupin domain-containing protein [bacterium]